MAEFTEAEVFDVFGIEQPDAEQTAGTDDAGTAGTSNDEDAGTAETSADTGTAEATPTQEEPDDGGETADTGTDSEAQTPEERRENAARRRRAEQQAAIDQAVEDALKAEREKMSGQWSDFFQKANLKNTLTGKPITTLDEFEEWSTAFEQAKLERDLKAGRLTPEGLNRVISQNPAIKRAEELVQREQQQRQQANNAEIKAKIEAELAEIHAMDPAINSVQDLLNMPNGKQFREYVEKGNTFIDAYYLANRTNIQEKTAQAARQQAAGNARSKEHLTASGNVRGAGAASVPADEMAMFRLFNPEASEADIQAYYNKTKK